MAIFVAVVVFFLAVCIAWLLKRYQITDSVGFIVVVILPFVAYGVASGFIAKISLPGGWAAEFRQIASAEIKPVPLSAEVENLSIISKSGTSDIQKIRGTLDVGKPIAISLRVGRQGYYSEAAIADYIRAFLTFDANLTVLFVENDGGRFVASANGNSVLAAVEVQEFSGQFLRAIEASDLLALRRLVVLSTSSVKEGTTNAEALQMMVTDGVDAIIKVDGTGSAVGLVRRDEIVSRLMLKLAMGG